MDHITYRFRVKTIHKDQHNSFSIFYTHTKEKVAWSVRIQVVRWQWRWGKDIGWFGFGLLRSLWQLMIPGANNKSESLKELPMYKGRFEPQASQRSLIRVLGRKDITIHWKIQPSRGNRITFILMWFWFWFIHISDSISVIKQVD